MPSKNVSSCSDFCCPICGSEEYSQVTNSNGILGPGGRSWILYNICSGCSVLFADVEKFTKAKKRDFLPRFHDKSQNLPSPLTS